MTRIAPGIATIIPANFGTGIDTRTGPSNLRPLLIAVMVYSLGFVLAALIVCRAVSAAPPARRMAYVTARAGATASRNVLVTAATMAIPAPM